MSKKYKSVIALFITIILVICFLGCIENQNDPNKIIGKWMSENVSEGEEGSVIFQFYTNGSYLISVTIPDESNNLTTTNIWNNYTIDNEILIMKIVDVEERLLYSFSDDYNTLTLTEEDSSTETVLFRQE